MINCNKHTYRERWIIVLKGTCIFITLNTRTRVNIHLAREHHVATDPRYQPDG